ncbi:Cof-type HAD-IIB family hydrolase [Sphingopyxis sp. SE2]|uniref:Cof-type HAD-IIB family hydrolase n=1 Tax=Sphingopyxis sp. SE2 TaxID=1586240 RepID=UPI0028BFB283|nr:Cof-type HAD-IIB family hydrolase [Sphingopyxis sp. SE2]MDT7531217.1 Cof-type HAD-IIB family hydrolase [Sphingopyxis sp. SE2]
MKVRLVVSDVDGTLVDSHKQLAEATVAAVKRLTDAGIRFTIISARPPSGMYWIAEKLKLGGLMGAFNGGMLLRADGRIAAQQFVPADLARDLLALYEKYPVSRWLFADGEWLATDGHDNHVQREIKSANIQPARNADFSAKLGRVDKLVAVTDDHDLLCNIEQEALALGKGRATIVRSQVYYLDATAREANKGAGIERLAKAFGVSLNETVALGDQANDIAMFRRAGFSVVMGQAGNEVKKEADEVSTSNDNLGVAHAIDHFILKDCL